MYIVFFAISLGIAGAELSWKGLTPKNFTIEHNLEIIKLFRPNLRSIDPVHAYSNVSKSIDLSETIFTLYTRTSAENGTRIEYVDFSALVNGNFNISNPTIVATHGYMSSGDSGWLMDIKTAYLTLQDCNYITIDWSSCASSLSYVAAKSCTKSVGLYLAAMLKHLNKFGANYKMMHLLGHSLGAHVVAQVSRYNVSVGRITGWDPAGPLFDSDNLPDRIDPDDAEIVDIIHTDCSVLGYDGIVGDYDFFPNNGDHQAGCIGADHMCSHSQSYKYYLETIIDNYKYPAHKCKSFADAKKGICIGDINYMGAISYLGQKGIYNLHIRNPIRDVNALAIWQIAIFATVNITLFFTISLFICNRPWYNDIIKA